MPIVVLPPSGAAMMSSLRGVGYTLESALADIVDNSISAGARTVQVIPSYSTAAGPSLAILDDGAGMGREHLVHRAMKLGGNGPLRERGPRDLGRFGLGLKTASFSQAKRLVVISKRKGEVCSASWDLDHIVATDAWELLENPQLPDSEALASLRAAESGTLVLLDKMDRFGPNDDPMTRDAFYAALDLAETHLGFVFHRFLSNSDRGLQIRIGAAKVLPRDPFLSTHHSTARCAPAFTLCNKHQVKVEGFILPPSEALDLDRVHGRSEGVDGWLAGQGFYVYRADRLLVAGGWLGIGDGRAWTRDNAYKLARISIDIPVHTDTEWTIDIKKSSAKPPASLRAFLRAYAIRVREQAKKVLFARSAPDTYSPPRQIEQLWKYAGEKLPRYRVAREHALVASILSKTGDSRPDIERLLSLLELSVPIEKLYVTDDDAQEDSEPQPMSPDIRRLLRTTIDGLRNQSLKDDVIRLLLVGSEPFASFPDAVDTALLEAT